MKTDSLTSTLVGVLALSTVVSVVFLFMYAGNSRQLRDMQMQMMFINTRRAAITALVNETVEYSKTHPAIDPVLVSVGLKPAAGNLKNGAR
jgi:hypothetical protein